MRRWKQLILETSSYRLLMRLDCFVDKPVEDTETEDDELSVDEAMSLEDILLTIPVGVLLPSVGVEISKITMGKDIKIPGFDERAWYLANLPKIKPEDKGKKPLEEKDPVIRYSFICVGRIEGTDESTRSYVEEDVLLDKPIVHNEVPRQLSYEDTLPAVSTFFKLLKRDGRMCVWRFVNSLALEIASIASQNVQLAFCSVVEEEDNQMDIDQRLASPTTTPDSSMNFIDNDILLGDDATYNQPSLPTVATNISTYLDDFITILWQRLDAQSEDISHIGEDFRKLIQNVRQDGRTLDDVQSLCFNEFRKGFLAHSAAVTADSMDFKKEFRALNAKVTSLDEQVAATRNDLLEFRAQAQETLNLITDQLSELIAYINRGGNDKRGEVSSSRPQPPSDDQNRGSGNTSGDNVRTTDIVDRFSGSMSREGQNRGRSGGRSSSGNRSGSSKRRHYSSSGGPFRRSFEDWLG
ncbi:filament-like plant protein 6-like [Dorcoceras hygrometricum]|uniref:Filament-like plant protein 6-like n=1 Tax=Dorcoceras hygrometricum TaxID=472368 RepID=A0A2Z7A4I4_9LAMI|nr:filament-like plant protein 6-like [Dorcoceras hygrometricum]